jgi:4-amino-4-deoxy-L-arabinose transferase-like glycosyltransferase
MQATLSGKKLKPVSARVWRVSRERALELIALAMIVALAAALRFANLDALGEANHYYTAAVKAMLQSWHNFFFAAAEPGGSVSVDKPPVGLWLQVISAYFLGVNGFGVLLPQIVAGILSVIVVYHLVRRWFGAVAGLVAALALAITPVVVATDRNNTMDSTLILTLLLAAWAFIKVTERGKLRYLLLGSILVGIGFNIKMLEAYLPLPAFFALYTLGSPERLWRKGINLALATVLLLIVSLSWATIVDLTPADQRPYVGSSGDNSELSLLLPTYGR